MLGEIVTKSPLLGIPLAALFLFVGVFVGALVRTYGRRAASYDAVARLPLDEENER